MNDAPAVLICWFANEQYALPLANVREVTRVRPPTPVPGTPPEICGVIHHRGSVLPIVDIRPLLGLDRPAMTPQTRLVLLVCDDMELGLLADSVSDITAVPDSVEPLPTTMHPERAQFLSGVFRHADRPVAILQLGAVLGAIGRHVHA
ncbi:MAG: chemotaxis protein CheW [Herpetosiphon sp.]